MNDNNFVSVAMAVYNGEKYIEKQIDSIVRQLREQDELVISYNESLDNTYEIIKKYEKLDNRIRVYNCEKKGVISNFNNAITHSKNSIIFLVDQDDIWNENKIEIVLEKFQDNNVFLVLHNCCFIDDKDRQIDGDLFKRRNAKRGFVKNLLKNSYQGSCMAFRNELKEFILPIPNNVPMHDQWIGLCAERLGKVEFIDMPLLYYRMHESNTSRKSQNLSKKLKGIMIICVHYIEFLRKKCSRRKK